MEQVSLLRLFLDLLLHCLIAHNDKTSLKTEDKNWL